MHYYVYIHQTPNNKFYVGITTTSLKRRWQNGYGYRSNKHFYSAILKYGWDNITHEVIEVYTEDWMYELEQILISLLHSNIPEYGYNKSVGGEKSGTIYITEEEREEALKDNGYRWRSSHKKFIQLKSQQYYKDHKEEIKQKSQQYKKDHKEEILQYHRQYNQEHTSERKQYYKDHKEEIKQKQQQYKIDHKEERKQYMKQYRIEHCGYYKEYNREYRKKKKSQEQLS